MRLTSLLGLAGLAGLSIATGGCQTNRAEAQAPTPAPAVVQPEPRKAEVRSTAPVTQDGRITQRVYFPSGDEAGAQLLVEKTIPAELAAGRAGDWSMTVTNVSELILNDVVISEQLPAGVKIGGEGVSADGARAAYRLGTLKPGDSRTLKLSMSAANPGAVTVCTTASYLPAFCMTNNVNNPQLKIATAGPAEVVVCDPFTYTITVSNPGVGVARGVKVQQALPQGLTTTDGRNAVAVNVGDLAAGASKSYTVSVKAAKTGAYSTKASTSAEGGLAGESAEVKTAVKQPVLAITKAGTQKLFAGQRATYEITVTNKGDWVARGTVLTDQLAAGSQFVSATDGGTASADKVTWSLGDLQPGASKKVSVTATAGQIGTLRNTATATAACADAVSATAQTAVSGIPAILLEVVDNPDPVAIGGQTTYTIVVTNQGSAPGTNIRVVAGVEEAGQVVATGGDAQAQVAGNKVTFAPVATLAPKASVKLTVTVKAVKAADSRFRVQMSSDQIGRPVEETEATNFYE